ncbi:protein-glutamine gamma-glutamyltransferase K [Strongylocentrotus purpuratus]|uniref:Transglutaminase-like domain-containing protein n=1 Tax=Strongylocentrotus purpuratus TaxID=7668 RepID=A0A7M7P3C4_STRPU|nr:protein-glutamine gamma-glutamyltransferase K [Strongylocentrotus purpuratus]
MSTLMETADETGAGITSPPSPGRSVNVADAERAYLGEGRDDDTDSPSNPNQLSVKNFDYELVRNRERHHTSEYEIKNLFVRRGQAFDLDVTFNKVPKTEVFMLELTVRGAVVSSINRGTVIRMPFHRSQADTPGGWGIRVGSTEGAKYSLVINCPSDAIVSRYNVAVVIKDTEEAEPRYFRQDDPIYVLFNAWCREDSVHMAGDIEKGEYVLNDNGYVFIGSARPGSQYPRPWVFGQFEDSATEVVFDLLEKWVRVNARSDPVVVSRKFTHLINYMPEYGVPETKVGLLVGNWSGDYEGGESPSKWTGSTKIYETFAESGGKPVKYGQCWVFSGVLCTAMRCLGIPCRSVTNFASAHDTDVSMTIDTVIDSETNEEIEYLSNDSVWNFHVWNEVYYSRSDTIPGMGGWQVVDATPQESSEGVFQCGPAPVTAIKQGLTYINYDTKFAFAEVNADRINWVATKKDRGPPDMKTVSINTNAVGKYISTKKLPLVPGGYISRWNARNDITLEYKYAEGSVEERNAVERAISYGTRPNTYRENVKTDDIEMAIVLDEKISVGSDFELKVAVNNKSSVSRVISLTMNAHMCYYTGVLAKKITSLRKELTVPAGKSEHVIEMIRAEIYSSCLVDQACIKFYVYGKVKETSQQTVSQDTVYLTPPEMKTEFKVVGHEVEAVVEFVNPLPITLTNCTITFEGARLLRSMTLYANDVPSKGNFKQKVKFSPREKGKRTLVIDFDSKQIGNITDVVEIEIP